MKSYYYLLYRIYCFYRDTLKDKSNILFSVTVVSSLILYLIILMIYTLFDYFYSFRIFGNTIIILFMVSLGMINYFIFIRQKRFLKFNFKKDIRGGVIIVLFIIIISTLFIIVANYNRAKISKQKSQLQLNDQIEIKPSSEDTVRRWFKG